MYKLRINNIAGNIRLYRGKHCLTIREARILTRRALLACGVDHDAAIIKEIDNVIDIERFLFDFIVSNLNLDVVKNLIASIDFGSNWNFTVIFEPRTVEVPEPYEMFGY